MILNLSRDMLVIDSCDSLKVSISICNKKVRIDTTIFNKIRRVIVSYIDMKVSI